MPDEDTEQTIPYTRFAEVNKALKEATARLESIEAAHKAELSVWEKRAAKVQADHEAAVKRATELEQAVESERLGVHIARAGVADPDLVDLVRTKYLATDPKERPEFGAWYSEWAKEKPYLQGAAAPAATQKQAPPTPPNKGAKAVTPDTIERLAQLSPSEYAANRDAVLKELGFTT